jgi:hypothetical protein
VDDGTNQILSNQIQVKVGTPPVVQITNPDDGYLFLAGETIAFQCQGTSGSTGASLPASSHSWSMLMLHDDHTHPAISAQPGKTLSFTIPTQGHGFTSTVG